MEPQEVMKEKKSCLTSGRVQLHIYMYSYLAVTKRPLLLRQLSLFYWASVEKKRILFVDFLCISYLTDIILNKYIDRQVNFCCRLLYLLVYPDLDKIQTQICVMCLLYVRIIFKVFHPYRNRQISDNVEHFSFTEHISTFVDTLLKVITEH